MLFFVVCAAIRKTGHVTEYGVLAVLIWRAQRRPVAWTGSWNFRAALWPVILCALYAATDVFIWKLLRRDFGLSRTETERVIRDMVEAIVASWPKGGNR